MKLIIGLGNPGRAYARSRHNVGFRCLSYFAKHHSIRLDRKSCWSRIGVGRVDSCEVMLAKPQTFVNLSGKAVSCLVERYSLGLNDLLVVYDDLDLPLGKIRLRAGGSSGGHKGIDSIISALGSKDFPRIRVGIGRPQMSGKSSSDEDMIVSYVLSNFLPEEERVIKLATIRVCQAIHCFLTQGIEMAMNKFN